MSIEAGVRVAVRLLSIWVLLSAASELAGIAALDTSTLGYGTVVGTAVGGVGIQMLGAFLLWKYAPWFAERVAAGAPAEATISGQSPASATQAAVGVLGVFMLSEAIPHSLWFIAAFIASRVVGPSPMAGQPAYDAQMGLYTVGGIANLVTVLARLLVGLLLVLRSSVVSALVLTGIGSGAASRPTRG
jgi:hypothetical protein